MPARAGRRPIALFDVQTHRIYPPWDAQKATLDAFWREHGVSSKTHRATLTKVGETKGLFRDPDRLVERMGELEDVM